MKIRIEVEVPEHYVPRIKTWHTTLNIVGATEEDVAERAKDALAKAGESLARSILIDPIEVTNG